MAEKQSKWRIFTAGIIRENPVLRLVLGCCSALAGGGPGSGALGGGGCPHHGIRRFGHGPGHDVRSGLL